MHFQRRFSPSALFTVLIAGVLVGSIVISSQWNFEARIVPLAVCYTALACAVFSLCNEIFLRPATTETGGGSAGGGDAALGSGREPALSLRTSLTRAAGFFAWCGGYVVLAKLIGMLGAIFVFVALCVRFWGRETMTRGLVLALGMTTFSWLLFDQLLAIPWPQNLLIDVFPALQPYVR